jgi:hypothetical protein
MPPRSAPLKSAPGIYSDPLASAAAVAAAAASYYFQPSGEKNEAPQLTRRGFH